MAVNEEWEKPEERKGVSNSTGVLINNMLCLFCDAVQTDLSRQRLTAVLVLTTLISAFGSSFQYGYNVAVINSPAPVSQETEASLHLFYSKVSLWWCVSMRCCSLQFMQQFYNITYEERYGRPMAENLLTLLWSLSVSMYPLGGFFGSLMVAPLVNKLGR